MDGWKVVPNSAPCRQAEAEYDHARESWRTVAVVVAVSLRTRRLQREVITFAHRRKTRKPYLTDVSIIAVCFPYVRRSIPISKSREYFTFP